MNKSKLALIGAGAIGGYFIWGFDNVTDVEFTVVAEGERLERLKTNGVLINDEVYRPVFAEPKEAGIQDVIIIATKYAGLDSAIDMLSPMMGDDTIVLSVLNGVDSEEKVAAVAGKSHVAHSLMRIASRRTGEGIFFNPENTAGVFFGNVWMENGDEKLAKVAKIIEYSRCHYTIVENIILEMWQKFASNVANNLPQAVLDCPSAMYFDSKHGYFLAKKLWDEVRAVGLKKGIDVGEQVDIYAGVPKNSRYSTLQDLDAGRHTEVDMFAGQMMKMAAEVGVDVPYCEYTFHAIKVLEERNDGIF